MVRLIVNLYTTHVSRTTWNGVLSSSFEVLNDVRQGEFLVQFHSVFILMGCCLHLRMPILDIIFSLLVF